MTKTDDMDYDDKEILFLLKLLNAKLNGLDHVRCQICFCAPKLNTSALVVSVDERNLFICPKCEKKIKASKRRIVI